MPFRFDYFNYEMLCLLKQMFKRSDSLEQCNPSNRGECHPNAKCVFSEQDRAYKCKCVEGNSLYNFFMFSHFSREIFVKFLFLHLPIFKVSAFICWRAKRSVVNCLTSHLGIKTKTALQCANIYALLFIQKFGFLK